MTNHCPTNGVSLQTGELGVPGQGPSNWSVIDPGAGNRRGFVVFQHGLQTTINRTYPLPIPNLNLLNFMARILDFGNAVSADGWVFVYPSYQDDFTSTVTGAAGMVNDVTTDSGHGTRYQNSSSLWLLLLKQALIKAFGHAGPMVMGGFSWGAIRTARLLVTDQASFIGYIIHCAPTILETVDPGFTDGTTFYNVNWAGLGLGPSFLSDIPATIPGIWGYGTLDEALGYNGATTVAAGSAGVDVSTFTGTQTLSVASTSTIINNGALCPLLKVATSNGFAYIQYNTTGTGVVNNCKTLIGSGTLSLGGAVIQSLQTAIIADAQAHSLPLTANPQATYHEFTGTPTGPPNDSSIYAAWIASNMDPLAPANAF